RGSLKKLTYALLLPIIASIFHSGSIAVLLSYIIIMTFYDRKKHRFKFNLKTLLYGLYGIIFFYILNTLFSDLLFVKINSINSATELNKTVKSYTDGDSAYLETLETSNPIIRILLISIRMFYFIASPLPWDWRCFSDIFAFIFSSSFYLLTMFYGFKALNVKENKYKNLNIALIIMALVTMFFFSWGVANTGTALRHR